MKPTTQERMEALDKVEQLAVERLANCVNKERGTWLGSEELLRQLEILQRIDSLRHSRPHDGRI